MEVRCPVCHGRRFTRETLAVRSRDHDIAQVLDLTIEEALALCNELIVARTSLPLCDLRSDHALTTRSNLNPV